MVKQLLAFDEAVLLSLRRLHIPVVTRMMRIFTRVGDASSWVLLGLVLLAAGGAARHSGMLLGAAALAATLLSQTLKRVWKRARPSLGIGGFNALAENPDVFSFPSGHTCAAFAVAIALAGRGWLGPLHLSLAFAIGISRPGELTGYFRSERLNAWAAAHPISVDAHVLAATNTRTLNIWSSNRKEALCQHEKRKRNGKAIWPKAADG